MRHAKLESKLYFGIMKTVGGEQPKSNAGLILARIISFENFVFKKKAYALIVGVCHEKKKKQHSEMN